ncbi:MAG: hypothetical protein WCF80_07850 [Pseudolabrys sp.]
MCDFTALIVVHDDTPSASEGHAQSPLNALPHIVLYEAGLPSAAIKVNEHTKEIEGDGLRRACSFRLPFGGQAYHLIVRCRF